MGFMQGEITEKTLWYEVDGPYGTEFIPHYLVGDSYSINELTLNSEGYRIIPAPLSEYCLNTKAYNRSDAIRVVNGYGVRSSAPGYLDCTEWAVYSSKREAEKAYRTECKESDF